MLYLKMRNQIIVVKNLDQPRTEKNKLEILDIRYKTNTVQNQVKCAIYKLYEGNVPSVGRKVGRKTLITLAYKQNLKL